VDRRRFLLALSSVGLASLAGPARALGPSSRIRLQVLDVGGPNERALSGARVLASEIRYRTSIDVADEPVLLRATDPRFPTQALAILAGSSSFSLSPAERDALSRWISLGGFLWVDNGGPDVHSASFDRSVRRELGAMFPGRDLERVSADHVLYRSFYRLDYPAGRAIHRPYVEGLTLGPRLGVVLHHNDLLGALERPPGGSWVSRPEPGGESQREMAIRFGVNATMYGLCQHYKDDQVHLDYLLHRRKWRIRQTGNP
jgi:hypothetical protein